jgi:hypothetical protein
LGHLGGEALQDLRLWAKRIELLSSMARLPLRGSFEALGEHGFEVLGQITIFREHTALSVGRSRALIWCRLLLSKGPAKLVISLAHLLEWLEVQTHVEQDVLVVLDK